MDPISRVLYYSKLERFVSENALALAVAEFPIQDFWEHSLIFYWYLYRYLVWEKSKIYMVKSPTIFLQVNKN